jgi:hypothetical protein
MHRNVRENTLTEPSARRNVIEVLQIVFDRVDVMITLYQMLSSIAPGKNRKRFLVKSHITEMINLIAGTYDGIPPLGYRFMHLFKT